MNRQLAGAAAAVLCLLAGCANPPVIPIRVPVPVACQEETPARPAMPTEAFKEKPKTDELLKASLAENERREGFEGQLRTALDNCKAPIRP